MRKIEIALFLILLSFSCQKTSAPDVCDDSTTSLYKLAKFEVGVAVNVGLLQSNPAYRNIVINQYNVVKPEISSLVSYIHPQQYVYDYSDFDYLANFCATYHKHFQGANLMYQLYLPAWVTNFKGDKEAWDSLAKSHIQTVVSHYKGVIESWMVVNEGIKEDGSLDNNFWQQHLGDDYVEKFFTWAHEADPDATLFYNDYNLESNPTKMDAALKLADRLRSKGIRIDGIGMQMHIYSNYPSVDEINRAAQKVAAHDYKVYYSEWDISFNYLKDKTEFTNAMKQQQKDIIKNVVKGYKELPVKYQYGISFWNVGDSDSWIRSNFHRIDWPLMFDDQYKPKPAYCGFVEALNEPL